METKIQDIKSKRLKNDYKISKVSEICGCSAKQVRNRRNGKSGNRRVTELGEKIDLAWLLLEQAENDTVTRITNIVNPNPHAVSTQH